MPGGAGPCPAGPASRAVPPGHPRNSHRPRRQEAPMAIVLGPNQFGKAEVRLVHVDRSTPVHRITDLNVSSALRGDFTDAHLAGDNAHILTTDAQKNTVYAFARDGVGEIEQFALRLGRHFARSFPWVT